MADENIYTDDEGEQMIAEKPEEVRHRILTERIRRILEMPEEDRTAAVGDMFGEEGMLSDEDRIKIVKTRTDILIELPKEKRDILLGDLKKVVSTWTETRKLIERRTLEDATRDYFILKRKMVQAMFEQILAS